MLLLFYLLSAARHSNQLLVYIVGALIQEGNSFLSLKSHTQALTQEEFVHLPPGEVDSQQDAEQDSEYIRE